MTSLRPRFHPILRWWYTVPGVFIIPMPLFRANVTFSDRKNRANVGGFSLQTGDMAKFGRFSPGVRPIFWPRKLTDREFSPLIGYNSFPIAADHHRAGIKKSPGSFSHRGETERRMSGWEKKAKPFHSPLFYHRTRVFGPCSQFVHKKGSECRTLSAFVALAYICDIDYYILALSGSPAILLASSLPPSRFGSGSA